MSFKTKANTYLIWRRIWNRYSFFNFSGVEDPAIYLAQSLSKLSQSCPGKISPIIVSQSPQVQQYINKYVQSAGVSICWTKSHMNDQVNSSSMIFFAHPGSVQYLALWFYDYTFFIKYNMYFEKFSSPLLLLIPLIVTFSYKRLHNIPERKIIKIP